VLALVALVVLMQMVLGAGVWEEREEQPSSAVGAAAVGRAG
jgi:hypothetical protein